VVVLRDLLGRAAEELEQVVRLELRAQREIVSSEGVEERERDGLCACRRRGARGPRCRSSSSQP